MRNISTFAAIGFGLFLASGQAMADDKPSAAERNAIVSCIKKQTDASKTVAPCVGRVADPCIKAAKNFPDKEKDCARKELAVWSDQLKALMAGGSHFSFPENKQLIIDSAQPWMTAREKLCAIFDKIEPGFLHGGADYCRLQETARRVVWIKIKIGRAHV